MATRGRPFASGNKFGRGRPRGSRNKTTLLAQELLESYSEPVVKKCLQKALMGEDKALQICMDRILPVRRDLPVKLGKVPVRTAADVSKASEIVLQKVAAGELTPAQGQAMAELIDMRRRAIETEEFEHRLKAVEAQNK